MPDVAEARPASTVVLLRDGADGLETLLLKRNKALMFAGGYWVFPGGALESADLAAADGDIVLASRLAAAREAEEESGLQPHLDDMVLLSHWTTPVVEPRRFSTWIYAAPLAADKAVVIDNGEIHDSSWLGIGEALALHAAGELGMLPPTFVTLLALARYDATAQLVTAERTTAVPEVLPVFAQAGELLAVLFPGDAGYESTDPATPGARHRAVLEGRVWRYLYEGVDATFPALAG